VVPYLRQQGIEKVDRLILSHADADHAGGAADVMASPVEVGEVLVGEPVDGIAGQRPCRAGERWRWDGVTFRILWPEDGRESGNAASCVLRVDAGGTGMLLTGDAPERVERRLLQHEGNLAADLLAVPHHGSLTSSAPAFIAAVHPDTAVVSAGYRNAYGLPEKRVVRRYRRLGTSVLNTATSGALSFRLTPSGLEMLGRYRVDHRRVYHAVSANPPVSAIAPNPL
jgi:competence protein ComEC